jgi:spore coat protein CotH
MLLADKADSFFDGTAVREIRLTFDDANWYQTLYQAHSSNSEDPYFPARFQCGDVVIEKIGARFKGNASFRRSSSVKKSFKLDFNAYDDTAKFVGLKKLNLNNGDLQPDFMREKLFLDLASQYIAASRVAHVRLYVNDVLWGLYVAVEQPDKTMMESRFGDSEDGNLYEAGESNATMSYLGADAGAYQQVYELKTNETANDYSGLISFLDILNNTATADLPAKLEPICDVENMLYGIALDILFANLDSYVGSGSEYYLYQRSDSGQFVRIHWDLNESFGTTGDGSPSVATPAKLDPFYLPTTSAMGGGAGGRGGMPGGTTTGTTSTRPLMQKLWAVDSYKRLYLQMLARMLREGFNPTAMEARIKTIAD